MFCCGTFLLIFPAGCFITLLFGNFLLLSCLVCFRSLVYKLASFINKIIIEVLFKSDCFFQLGYTTINVAEIEKREEK